MTDQIVLFMEGVLLMDIKGGEKSSKSPKNADFS